MQFSQQEMRSIENAYSKIFVCAQGVGGGRKIIKSTIYQTYEIALSPQELSKRKAGSIYMQYLFLKVLVFKTDLWHHV